MYHRLLLSQSIFLILVGTMPTFAMEFSDQRPSDIIRSPSPILKSVQRIQAENITTPEDFIPQLIQTYEERTKDVKKLLRDYFKQHGTLNPILLGTISSNEFSLVRYLVRNYSANIDVNKPDQNGESALYKAANIGSKAMIEYLLSLNSDVNMANATGDTPLHAGAKLGHISVIESLLRAPTINIEAQNAQKQTPLVVAVKYAHWDAYQVLINAKANPHVTSKDGKTLLHTAVESGSLPILLNLIHTRKLDTKIRDDHNRTPYDIACKNDDQPMMNNLKKKRVNLLG